MLVKSITTVLMEHIITGSTATFKQKISPLLVNVKDNFLLNIILIKYPTK